jgi:hypothetical protein
VLQVEAGLEPNEKDAPPETFDAKVESFFFTCGLPHFGQVSPRMASVLRSNSSNGWRHSLHTNSKIGMIGSWWKISHRFGCTEFQKVSTRWRPKRLQ